MGRQDQSFTLIHPTQLKLLGGCRLERQGQALPGLAYRKAWGLLAHLLMEPGWHARPQLAHLLGLRSAGHLRQLLSSIRGALDQPDAPSCLETDGGRVRFNPVAPVQADVTAFQAGSSPLEERARLYQGEFLAGLEIADAPDFDEWRQARREALRLQALALFERLSQEREAQGDPDQALQHARRMVDLDPWNEAGHRRVMQLLAQAGQAAAALAQFDVLSQQLHHELGVPPDASTQALCRRIRAGELAPSPPPGPSGTLQAERRLVTVLCAELSVPGEDDIEAVADTLREPQQWCEQHIAAQGGRLLRSHGGGMQAYFGYPLAQENAARMAVSSALRIRDTLPEGVGFRAGVHTGFIVVEPADAHPDAAGLTSADALRARDQAGDRAVCLTGATEQLVRGYFHLTPAPRGPAGLFEVQRASEALDRLDVTQHRSPFVGREAELERLHSRWAQAPGLTSRAVLLQGDPGIGKSRLVRAFGADLMQRGTPVVELQCLAEYRHSPLHPIRNWLERWLNGATHTPAQTLARLQQALPPSATDARSAERQTALRALAHWVHEAPDPAAQPPDEHWVRADVFDALTALLTESVPEAGTLLVVEDLHWCDPSTLEWLERHLGRPQAPGLTLITTRPQPVRPGIAALADLWNLPPLPPEAMASLVRGLAPLSAASTQHIVAQADGIALFAEELTLMAAGATGTAPKSLDTAPLSLQDLLASRLDATGGARRTAQLAATIGRQFATDVLIEAAGGDARRVMADLEVLLDHQLLQWRSDGAAQFRHALIQRAAHDSQTRAQRKSAHQAVAQALKHLQPQRVRAEPEILAHHLTQAGEPVAALEHWLEAGRMAVQRSAHHEALSHLDKALQDLPHIPDARQRQTLEFDALTLRGGVLVALEGYGASSAHQCFLRAIDLAPWARDRQDAFGAMYGLWLGAASNGHTLSSLAMADELDRIAQVTGDPSHRIATDYAYGNNLFWLGRFAEARVRLEAATALHPNVPAQRLTALTGENHRVLARAFLAWTLCFLDEPRLAQQHMAQALADAHADHHVQSLCFALAFAATLHRHCGEAPAALTCAQELAVLAEHHRLQQWGASAAMLEGWARVSLGDPQGLALVQQGAEAGRNAHRSIETTYGSFLLDALHRLGRHGEALACAEHLLQACIHNEDHYLEPEFLRLQALSRHALGQTDAPQMREELGRALALAQAQGSRMLARRIGAAE